MTKIPDEAVQAARAQFGFSPADDVRIRAALTAALPFLTAGVKVEDLPKAEAEFTAYFVKNYPGPDTLIHKPEWHAPKIFRAALHAIRAAIALDASPMPCDCTKIQQDESCPVGYPSLLCETCDGRGIIGGMYRVGDGDVDGWEEPCPDCTPHPRRAALEEAARVAEGESPSFDHQSALAECRDCDSGFHLGRVAAAAAIRALAAEPATDDAEFQDRVKPWMLACFGEEISNDKLERCDRFIEEALELVQAIGYSPDRGHALVDYVFNREIGEPHQEVGGVMVTLAALCLASGLDMNKAGEDELARIWTKVDKIRAKQAAKPTGSALPIATTEPATDDGWLPIESAPKTGFFLAWSPDFPEIPAVWKAELFHQARKPGTPKHISANHWTHWRPLPTPPAETGGGE